MYSSVPGHFVGALPVVADAPDGAVPLADLAAASRANLADVDLDVDAEVGAALLDGVAQIPERHAAVLAGVARDDEAAAAADQFVDAEVLEVAAVRQVHPLARVGGHAEQFVHQLAAATAAGRNPSTGLGRPGCAATSPAAR